MYKKLLATTFAIIILSSILSISTGTMTPAFAEKQNHNKVHLPKVIGNIPFGTNNDFGFTVGNLANVAVNENNHRVYAVANDTVYVIDGKTNSFIASIPVGLGAGTIAVDKNTNKVYVANGGNCCNFDATINTVSVIDGKTNKVIDTIPIGHNNLFGIAVNEKTNRIYVNSYDNVTATVIDGKTDKVIDTVPLNFEPTLLDINSKTNTIYEPNYSTMLPNGTVNYDGNIQVINGANDKILITIPADGGVEALAVNEKTNRIYATSFNDGTLLVVDGKTNQVVDDIPLSFATYGVAASENTNRIYVVNEWNSTLSVIDGTTNKVIDTVSFGTPTPSCLFDGTCLDFGTVAGPAALDDKLGRIYVVGFGDGILYEFDTNTHNKIAEMHFGHHHK